VTVHVCVCVCVRERLCVFVRVCYLYTVVACAGGSLDSPEAQGFSQQLCQTPLHLCLKYPVSHPRFQHTQQDCRQTHTNTHTHTHAHTHTHTHAHTNIQN